MGKRVSRGQSGKVLLTHSLPEVKKLGEGNRQLKKLLEEKDLETAILRNCINKEKSPHLLKKYPIQKCWDAQSRPFNLL